MTAVITGLAHYLPTRTESIADLVASFPDWSAERIARKTGIQTRHIAAEGVCASDLGVAAAQQLFDNGDVVPGAIDFLLFCTQTPDYLIPSTACLVQDRLGLGTHVGALDINLGCSGYIYSLGVAKALIESGQARRVLLITADTYSKLVHPGDRSVRALFSDGASATVVSVDTASSEQIGPFVYGTDGSGAGGLIVPSSAMREPQTAKTAREYTDHHGNTRSDQHIFMDGRAVVEFSQRVVPDTVDKLCDKAGIGLDEVDVVVPHQASATVLDNIRENLGLAEGRFVTNMAHTGNTVSSSIPIAMQQAGLSGQLQPGALLLLVGFGVGLSWGATLVRLPADCAVPGSEAQAGSSVAPRSDEPRAVSTLSN